MALVNDAKKEIHAKIVYYGPGRSGKTTNLEYIYNKLKPEYRGKFKFMNTPSGRMVFFDFMRPELAGIKDFSIRFHIYTVPGEVTDEAIWKNVLKGADGIVFIADSDPSRVVQNRVSLENLKAYLSSEGRHLGDIPVLFQGNKKDIPQAMPADEIRNLLDTGEFPFIPANAKGGEGVLPALSEMVKMMLQKLRDTLFTSEGETPPAPAVQESEAPAEEPVELPVPEPEPMPEEPEPLHFEEEYPSQATEPFAFEFETVSEDSGPVEEAPVTPVSELDRPQDQAMLSEPSEITVDAVFPAPMDITEESGRGDEQGEALVPAMEMNQSGDPDSIQPEILLSGVPELLGTNGLRLPLVIRYGDREMKTALTLNISLERTTDA
jgi:signal recognition particle receptor subunit beta